MKAGRGISYIISRVHPGSFFAGVLVGIGMGVAFGAGIIMLYESVRQRASRTENPESRSPRAYQEKPGRPEARDREPPPSAREPAPPPPPEAKAPSDAKTSSDAKAPTQAVSSPEGTSTLDDKSAREEDIPKDPGFPNDQMIDQMAEFPMSPEWLKFYRKFMIGISRKYAAAPDEEARAQIRGQVSRMIEGAHKKGDSAIRAKPEVLQMEKDLKAKVGAGD